MSSTRTLLAAGAAAALLAMAGCGSASPLASSSQAALTSSPDAGPADSYLATGSGWVNYIQWDSTGTGTLTADTLTGTAPDEQVSSSQSSIVVTIDGSSVDISGLSSAKYGTLSSGKLTLQVLASNGTLVTDTFTPAGQSAFNSAVQALQQQAQSDNSGAVQQEQQASQASANATAEQQASSDLATVQGVSLTSDLGQLASDVKQTGTDFGTVKADAGNGQGDYCSNADTVASDADTVASDADTVSSDLDTLTNDLHSDRSAISTLQDDLTSLQNMNLAAPSGAQAAISAAQSAIRHAVSTANADIQQENGLVSQAYQVANGLASGQCSDSGPGSPPSPIQDIS
jgi:trimeric autotransporter adhesin